MKAKYIVLSIAFMSVLCACNRDEKSLFESSAAERAQQALDNANSVFVAPADGWEMMYYAYNSTNDDKKKLVGFNILLKFYENGKVEATAKNSITTGGKLKTDSSTWVVRSDYGPILSFDTYNKVFHAWADPQGDGDGLLGDYEFLILSATKDLVILKGKKHSLYAVMRPKPKKEADDYFTECNAALAKYFGKSNIVTLENGGKKYYLHYGSVGYFEIVPYGQKAATEDPVEYPICATLDGIMLSYGFNDDQDERLFTFKGDKFVGEHGSIISAGDLSQLFITYIDVNVGWTADLTASTGAFADAATAFTNDLVSRTGDSKAKLNSVAVTYSDSIDFYKGAYLLRIKYEYKEKGKSKTTLSADYIIDVKKSGSNIVLTYKRPHNATATTWYERFPAMVDLINATMGTFTLKAIDPINPAAGTEMQKSGSVTVVSGSQNVK